MTMNSYLLAAERNNLGVVRLSQGDLRGALDLFRESLSFTAGNLVHPASPRPSTNSPKDAVNATGTTMCSPVTAATARAAPATCTTLTNASPIPTPPPPAEQQPHQPHAEMSATSFVHSKGINVIPMATAYSPDVLINMAIVSSIVVFNLAIVCHLKGLEGGPAANSRLFKAKSLYERSQRLLSDACVPFYSLGDPVTDMISMACLNNLAHLHYETAQYEETKHYFDQLIRFASTIDPALYGDAYVGWLMDRTKSNFLLNAIILQKPGLAPAA